MALGGGLAVFHYIFIFSYASTYPNPRDTNAFFLIITVNFLFFAQLAVLLPVVWREFMYWMVHQKDKEQPLPDPNKFNPLEACARFNAELRLPKNVSDILAIEYMNWAVTAEPLVDPGIPSLRARAVNKLFELIPAHGILTRGETPIQDFLYPTLQRAVHDDVAHSYFVQLPMLGEFDRPFRAIKLGHTLPQSLRTEHMQILANPGHGKSTLLTQMFFEDLKTDAGIVVIDSQGDLINELAKRVPADRLILVDPETCPPALNMFARKIEGEQGISNALSLFEYIFGSLGVSMTGRQEMVYRYLSRLCMIIPGGSISTLRDMLQVGGTEPYQEYINQMNENARAFFKSYQQPKNNEFTETRQQVLIRLLKVLESDTFASMLGANTMALDIPQALSEGKVILVSTAKNFLDKGASLLGRIFVAQVMQAVRNRKPGDRRRVYLYIDEFADYAEDSSILLDCFSQGRKYELGMIVAHQNLGQLTPQLADTISSSTAIKFAGGVSSEDSRKLGNQMRTDYHLIDAQPKGTFLAYFKDMGVLPWKVQLGFMNTVPVITDLQAVQADMRARYGAKRRPPSDDGAGVDNGPTPPRPKDDDFQDEQENW